MKSNEMQSKAMHWCWWQDKLTVVFFSTENNGSKFDEWKEELLEKIFQALSQKGIIAVWPHLARHEVVGGRRQVEGQGHRQGRPQHRAPRARALGLQLVSPDIESVIIIMITSHNCHSIKTYFSNLVCSRTCSWILWSSAFFSDICFLRELKSVKILETSIKEIWHLWSQIDQGPIKNCCTFYRALSLSPPVIVASALLTSSSLARVSFSSSLIGQEMKCRPLIGQ